MFDINTIVIDSFMLTFQSNLSNKNIDEFIF